MALTIPKFFVVKKIIGVVVVVINHLKQIDFRRIYLYGIKAADQGKNMSQDSQ
jgi:hypothetical protein